MQQLELNECMTMDDADEEQQEGKEASGAT